MATKRLHIDVDEDLYDRFWSLKNEAHPESGQAINHDEAFEIMVTLWEHHGPNRDPKASGMSTFERDAHSLASGAVDRYGRLPPALLALKAIEECAELVDEVAPDDPPPGRDDNREETAQRAAWETMTRAVDTGDRASDIISHYCHDGVRELPVSEWPAFPEDPDLDESRMRGEAVDAAAVLFQIQWAAYQGTRGGYEVNE